MKLAASLRSLVSALLRRSRVEREMDEELRSHIRARADHLVRSGLSRAEADRRARIEFGGYERFKQECREAAGAHFIETLLQDVRFGLRLLRKSPGFTAVAMLTLALGIGANTAIVSLLDALVFRNLPAPRPEQLVRFGLHSPDDPDTGLSLPMYRAFARSQKVFSTEFAWWGDAVLNVQMGDTLARADVWGVTGNFESELGAVPELGRTLSPQDVNLDSPAPPLVVVLGYGFWQRHFGGARDAIGKTIRIEGLPFTIVGVTRKGFTGFAAELETELTVPLTAEPLLTGSADAQKSLARPDALWLEAAGRLKPGMTLAQARAQLATVWPAMQTVMAPSERAGTERGYFRALQLKVEPGARGGSFLRGRFTNPLYALLAIGGVVLLIACVNLAGLMLARAASRSHEMAVRVALGAGRARLARQVLTESVMLSAGGALAGFLLAQWGSRALSDFIIRQLSIVPAALNLAPDWRVLGFTAAGAVATGLFFGLAPAWRAARADPGAALQQSSRALGGRTGGLGRGMIVTQVALSVVLLAAAGLLIRTLRNLRAADPGFRTRAVLDASLYPKPNGYKNLAWVSYYRALTDRVAQIPGVESAGIVHMNPGSVFEWTEKARVADTGADGFTSDLVMLMPGAFRTLGLGVLRGRGFTWQDDHRAPRVAIVSKSLAQKWFPAGDAIGRHLEVVTQPKWPKLEIVGVASDASLYDIRKSRPPTLYLPAMQYGDYMGWSQLLVQTRMPPAAIAGTLGQSVGSLGHEYVTSVKTVEQDIDRSLLQERVTAMLAAFFGALTLLLAAVGLYGLMAYAVARRTRELAIRVAFGATRRRILQSIMREALALVLAGLVIGIPCALAASRLVAHMLFGLSPDDPATLALVAGVLAAVGAMASYLPARRATRVDPMVALRQE